MPKEGNFSPPPPAIATLYYICIDALAAALYAKILYIFGPVFKYYGNFTECKQHINSA